MTDYIIDTEVQNTTETMTGLGDTLLVTSTGSLINPGGGDGIDSNASQQQITIDGLVYTGSDEGNPAVSLAGNYTTVLVNADVQGGADGVSVGADTGESIDVGSQGAITGGIAGVSIDGGSSNTLNNEGTISASRGLAGIFLEGDGFDMVLNSGTISGPTGIELEDNVATEIIENSGRIEGGGGAAISSFGPSSGVGISVVNSGSGLLTNAAANGEGVGANGVLSFNYGVAASTINNEGMITGAGYVIQSLSDILGISNSGTIHGGLYASSEVNIDNSGLWQAGTDVDFGTDGLVLGGQTSAITNSGKIEAPVLFGGQYDSVSNSGLMSEGVFFYSNASSTDAISNNGEIDGGVSFTSNALSGSDTITNTGKIDGGLALVTPGTDTVANSGSVSGGVSFSSGGESLTNAQAGTITGPVTFNGAGDILDNSGAIDGAVTLIAGGDTFTNAGSIDGAVAFSGAEATNSLTNSGSITGDVTLAGASSVLKNHGHIYGDVTLDQSDTLVNTGIIHGDVTLGASDTINDSRGEITDSIIASTSDTFDYKGLFGEETIDNFTPGSGSGYDIIQFAANDFGSFVGVQHAMHQVGADTVIRRDASDSITLLGVTPSSLLAADFKFV